MAAPGQTATQINPRDKVLSMWIKLPQRIFGDARKSSREIAKLHTKVHPCIRDFIVVRGEGKNNHEIIVIVNVNQIKDDQIQFNVLTKLIRELLRGAFEEVSYPKGDLYNPRGIYDSSDYLGWTPVRER